MEKRGKRTRSPVRNSYKSIVSRNCSKKAQFYLISAVIIVVVVMGLSGITNYSKVTKKPVKFYDLSSELSEESARVIDYGIYNGLNIFDKIEEFIDYNLTEYAKEKEKGSEFVFVYGDTKAAKIATYTIGESGTISFVFGNSYTEKNIQSYLLKRKDVSGEDVKVTVLGKEYNFPLETQQNFYFVIVKEKDKETYVATNPTFI